MKSRDFVYWLQGFFEIARGTNNTLPISLTNDQVNVIKKHLDLVFAHEIDPEADKESGKGKLDAIHGGTKLRC